jgi:hypothetical protein
MNTTPFRQVKQPKNDKNHRKYIEAFAIELLDKLGYEYIYAPDIAHDGENPERDSYAQVLLLNRLQNAVKRINHIFHPMHRQKPSKKFSVLLHLNCLPTMKPFIVY